MLPAPRTVLHTTPPRWRTARGLTVGGPAPSHRGDGTLTVDLVSTRLPHPPGGAEPAGSQRLLDRAVGEDDAGGGGRWDVDRDGEAVAGGTPLDGDRALRRLVGAPGPRHGRVRDGRDLEGLPGDRPGPLPQPQRVGVQETDHGALAVVVERVVGGAGVVDALPVLPDGGRATVEHVQPGGRCALEEQLVG